MKQCTKNTNTHYIARIKWIFEVTVRTFLRHGAIALKSKRYCILYKYSVCNENAYFLRLMRKTVGFYKNLLS